MTRIVRTRSIPNVPDERLHDDLARIHHTCHTVDGLRAWDDTRRSLIDLGRKGHAIARELIRRGHPPPDCRFCRPR